MMVRIAILYTKIIYMIGINGKMDSEYYTQVLKTVFLPVANSPLSIERVLKKRNEAFHTSRHTLDFSELHDINFTDCQAKSPDFNITENIWGYLAREVYNNERQIKNEVVLPRSY